MTNATVDITLSVAALVDAAFARFCEDIAGIFGMDVQCRRRQEGTETLQALRSHFAGLAAAHLVQERGTLDGAFHLLLDRGGAFILSGLVVMLPESRIIEEAARGSLEDAKKLRDAATAT